MLTDISIKIKKLNGDSTYKFNGNMHMRAKVDEDKVFR